MACLIALSTLLALVPKCLAIKAALRASLGWGLLHFNSYLYVLNWYEATFPNHENVPQFNEKNQIVNTPAHYDA